MHIISGFILGFSLGFITCNSTQCLVHTSCCNYSLCHLSVSSSLCEIDSEAWSHSLFVTKFYAAWREDYFWMMVQNRSMLLRNRYFTTINSFSMKTAADRNRLLLIATSSANELSGGTNVNDLERSWNIKIAGSRLWWLVIIVKIVTWYVTWQIKFYFVLCRDVRLQHVTWVLLKLLVLYATDWLIT